MTTIIEKLDKAQAALEAAKDKRKATEAQIIADHCPVKVGDVVPCNRYTHRGKNMVVRKLGVEKSFREWRWIAFGPVLKKDGSESLSGGEWAQPIGEDE